MSGAVTFDFHDTLARCDAWFELEVRRLASSFLRWQAGRTGERHEPAVLAAADDAYRRLRESIVADGRELPAEVCVARVLAELALPVDAATIACGIEALMRETAAEARPVTGALETVQAPRTAEVRLGIISSAVYPPFLEWTLERFALSDAFADVTTSAGAGFYKSRPELFRQALAALGARPECSVHVGDSYRFDVAGAQRAGMKTVWLRPVAARFPDGDPPDLTIDSLDGAAPQILGLLQPAAA